MSERLERITLLPFDADDDGTLADGAPAVVPRDAGADEQIDRR